MKIRVIGHVARNRRIVAKHLVLHNMLARLHRVEEIGNMICSIIVSLRCGECLRQRQSRSRLRMRRVPFFQVFPLRFCRPPIQRVAFRLRPRILRRHGKRISVDRHRGFLTVKDGSVARRVVLIAVHIHRHAGIVVERHQQVREIAPVLEMGQASAWSTHAREPRSSPSRTGFPTAGAQTNRPPPLRRNPQSSASGKIAPHQTARSGASRSHVFQSMVSALASGAIG